jgi:murein DD-endopeptidase MepM/ murein hydrolase activator NlpD
MWPVKGKVTSRFGYRKKGQRHDGIDIAAPKGAAVYAARSGKVIYSDNRLRYYGNTIILKHSGGWFTVYAHNGKHRVSVGQGVRKGEKIAEVGNSGRGDGYRLHFEVRRKDKPVDPLLYLPR